MLPKWHILIGGIFSVLIFLIFDVSFLSLIIFFFSSWLFIDFDHYLRRIIIFYRKKRKFLTPKEFWDSSMNVRKKCLNLRVQNKRLKYKLPIYIFHGIEPLIILFVLYYFVHGVFLWVFLGFLLHLITDMIYDSRHNLCFFRFSIFYNLITNRNKKDFPLFPEEL